MEEVYIIKLKGLPVSESSEVSKKPSIYANDLSVEVLYGLGLFHVVIGLITILFGLITVASDEWKVTATGIGCGTIFVSTGFVGIWSSIQRKDHFLSSNIAVRIFLFASTLSLVIGFCSIILMLAGLLDIDTDQLISSKLGTPLERRTITDYDGEIVTNGHSGQNNSVDTIDVSEVHPHIKTNLLISLVVEMVLSFFTAFTSCRILWPDSLKSLGGANWPTRPEVRKKIIVKTSIHASSKGLYQASDFSRALGPNCVVSLSPPKSFDSSKHMTNHQIDVHNEDDHRQLNRQNQLTSSHSFLQNQDSVSLASYDDTEFGHEGGEESFLSRTNSPTSHLLHPSFNCNEDSVNDQSITNESCVLSSFSSFKEREMNQTDKENGVINNYPGDQGNWDHHHNRNHNQELKLKPSVKVGRVDSKKKRIPAPKQPPPPPPSTLPPPLVVSQQLKTHHSKIIATSDMEPRKVIKDSPGHCVQNGYDHIYGHNDKLPSVTDDGASCLQKGDKIESERNYEKIEGCKMKQEEEDHKEKDEIIKDDEDTGKKMREATSDKFIHFMNNSPPSVTLTVAQQLSSHLNRLKLNKMNSLMQRTMNGSTSINDTKDEQKHAVHSMNNRDLDEGIKEEDNKRKQEDEKSLSNVNQGNNMNSTKESTNDTNEKKPSSSPSSSTSNLHPHLIHSKLNYGSIIQSEEKKILS